MKNIFRKILMSVICVMLVMPVDAGIVVCPITWKGGKWIDLTNVSFSVSGGTSAAHATKHKSGRCFNIDISCDKFNQKKVSVNVTAKGYAPMTLRGDGTSCSYNAKMEKGKQLVISGKVVNEKTGKPVANADIRIITKDGTKSYSKATCKTDSNGAFNASFDDIPSGARMKVYHEDYQEQEVDAGSNIQVKLTPRKPIVLKTVVVEGDACPPEVLAKLHAKAGVYGGKTSALVCVPSACVDTHTLVGTECVEKSVAGTTPDVTAPNGEVPGTTPGVTDPNVVVSPVGNTVVTPGTDVVPEIPVVIVPKPATMTGNTVIKSLAVRLALNNDAPSQIDKNKFADLLGAADNISIREILIACIKSMPADVACNQCEAFIRSMVNYHNNN